MIGKYISPADIKVVTFTPEQAQKMLDTNYSGQRKIKHGKVNQFVTLLKQGKWNPYLGDTIKVADGVLIDGQHRFMAAVIANKAITVLYCDNFTLDDFSYIDAGTSRSGSDALGSVKNSNVVAAYMRLRICYKRNGISFTHNNLGSISNSDIAAEYEGDIDQEIVCQARRIRDAIGGLSTSALAFFVWLMTNKIQARYEQMLKEFLDEASSDLVVNHTFAAARKYISRMRERRQSINSNTTIEMVVRMWNSYASNNELKKIILNRSIPKIIGINA